MGHVLGAACLSCGYERELLEYHGGMGIEMEPQICFDWRELVSVSVSVSPGSSVPENLNRCPLCNGINLERFFNDVREPGQCPRCSGRIRVWSVGIWD